MNPKELCMKLALAESEQEVSAIIKNHPTLARQEGWKHYGDVANNIGTITGQHPEAVPSLIEKITNSIDALLIKKCIMKGDDPKSPSSAQSIDEALERYFDLNDAKYLDMKDSQRRDLASNIQVIAEGPLDKPNMIIEDSGEGQNPQDFPNTFVSLNKKNKSDVFFVQGKYNMGGTATLPFCGDNRYQLIISRKGWPINENNKYGFTLVRRNRGSEEHVKCSWYEYCIDENGKIFEFDSRPLELGLFGKKFEYGTYIKLYNYGLTSPSDITLDLWRELNRYLYKPALPILLFEKRYEKGRYERGRTPTKVMHGNRMRCFLDDRENVENKFPINIESDGVKYPGEVFVFNRDVSTREFVRDMALTFSVNGQVQHSINNSFISQELKKAYLKGHILINIDCSDMPRELHEDIFMSSRSQMRNIAQYRNLVDNIIKELKDNEYLTDLDEEWRKELIFKNPKDESFLKNIVGRLLKDDKEIEKLLGFKGGIIGNELTKVKKHIEAKREKFAGKRYPTIFRFTNLQQGKYKMLPQNGECKINIETDVENEYLMRPHDKGELKIRILRSHSGIGPGPNPGPGPNYEDSIDVNVVGPNEGSIRLRVKPKKPLPVGARVPIDIEMSSPDGPHHLIAEVVVDKPHSNSTQKDVEKKKEYSLPTIIDVYREKKQDYGCWADYGWNELDICHLQESSEEGTLIDAVAINMESQELDKFVRAKKLGGKRIEVVQRTYKISVYLISLVLFYELQQKLKKTQETNEDKYTDEKLYYDPTKMTSYIMKGLAKILLHVMANETMLKEIEDSD
ncbi:MAG: hypothetical protein PHQ35_05145 [Phycisphaerae bacterium]|nr:hypothetical protein [Phycisphaerae bacterium]MDD5380897.1 hypothetical protein [Phycisphaerae bacterium]